MCVVLVYEVCLVDGGMVVKGIVVVVVVGLLVC